MILLVIVLNLFLIISCISAIYGYTLNMNALNKSRFFSSGFTLIELVVVIALLGILAAAALPRMMKSYDGAHESSVTATGGALASAVMLLRSQWVTNGAKGSVDAVDGYGEDNVATSAEGWPTDGNNGAGSNHGSNIQGDDERCARLWKNLLVVNAPKVSADENDPLDYLAQAPSGSICRYTYLMNDQNSRIEYNLSNGSVTTIL